MQSKRTLFLAVLAMVCVMGAAAQDWPGADSSNSGWPGTEKKADKQASTPAPAPAPAPAAESPPPAQSAASAESASGDSGTSDAPKTSSTAPRKKSGGGGGGLLAVIIGYISQIGAIFGKIAGVRIGGTTGTGIITLVIAQMLKDKAPDWVRYVLMAGGGTMFAGSGANILQLLM